MSHDQPELSLHQRLRAIVERTAHLLDRTTALLERTVAAAETAENPLPAREVMVMVNCFKRITEIARIISIIVPPPVEPEAYKCPLSAEEIRELEKMLNEER